MSNWTEQHKLRRTNSGDDIRDTARSGRINALQSLSNSFMNGEAYSPASNTGVYRTIGPGFVVHRTRRPRIFGGGTFHFPWEITIKSAQGTYYITIRPGTVNNMLPSNMFQNLGISGVGTIYVIVHVLTDGQKPTNLLIDIATQPPQAPGVNPWVPPQSFDILLGVIVNVKVFQIISDPLNCQPRLVNQTLRDNPQPGQPYLQNNYTWQTDSA